MKDLIKIRHEKTKCSKCGKYFSIVHKTYPMDMEGKHESYYCCPFCGDITYVQLRGNEDIDSQK